MKRVIGLGGVLFKSKNPAALREWYARHLGIASSEWGAQFEWRNTDEESGEACTVWNPFKEETPYFNPSQKQFMLNYVVANLDELLPVLKAEGVTIVGEKEESEFGKFAWIMDIEENKIELWEPPRKASS